MSECNVCLEKKCTTVNCSKCDVVCCQGCFQQYLLNCPLTPTCMKCRTTLSDEYVIDNTVLSWRTKTYKPYRAQLIFDTERARLPETQEAAEMYKKACAMSSQASIDLEEIGNAFTQKIADIDHDSLNYLQAHWKLEADQIVPQRTLYACRPVISSFGLRTWTGDDKKKHVMRAVVKACITTGCVGFLNDEFCCGLCDVKVCKACHESVVDEHVCNADTVATIKALKAEAKGCPKCSTLISKIDGCDQMWCTQCHTTFSWRTGQIEAGHTHNPHYYEWARKNGGLARAPGDAVCGGFPALTHLLTALRLPGTVPRRYMFKDNVIVGYMDKGVLISDLSSDYEAYITNIHRLFIHVEETIRRRLNTTVPENHELRVKYLIQEINEAKFKTRLQEIDKAYRKSVAKNQIYQMAYTVAGDLFRQLIVDKNVAEAKLALENLMNYSNKCLDRIALAYTCKVIHYKI